MSDQNGDPDWRIANARHLSGLTLHRKQYTQPTETWDHDHCAACWAKFAEFEGPDILHEGYATGTDYPKEAAYWWVCPTCFTDLEATLGWTPADDHQ